MIILCDGLFCGGVMIETYDNHDFGFDCVTTDEFVKLSRENDRFGVDCMDGNGCARLEDVAERFAKFYEDRVTRGLPAEKKPCIFTKGDYTRHDVERLILNMPFKRFEDMHAMHHAKQLGILQIYQSLFKQMMEEDIAIMRESSNEALKRYFGEE